ncbi:hypothetical protein HWV62_5310 [Athelia sp. TMB]|nr:hypothetical protein HWV62_5310 [Athelia sp. TMB]
MRRPSEDIECPAYDEPVHFTPVDFGKDSKDEAASPTDSESTLPTLPTAAPLAQATPTPSIRLLFSLLPRRQRLALLLPACASSIVAGGIAPFMTLVIGASFDAFASFPLTSPSSADKSALLHGVGVAALELVGLAAGAMALSSVTSALWIRIGEENTHRLRMTVYTAVMGKDMPWFDTRMGDAPDDAAGPTGAAGLMAKFARETDDVRAASSLAPGTLLQYLTTTLTCLALAFSRSWALTLVILSAVPALILIQALSQALVGPHLAREQQATGEAATRVERAASSIATVKAFNASAFEADQLASTLARLQAAGWGCTRVWAGTSALAQFAMMAMFVQGFWFGGLLVRRGAASAGDVMAVFWACLIATSNLQMTIPQLILVAKGKCAFASLLALAESTAEVGGRKGSAIRAARKPTHLRKILPPRCAGELALHAVSFAYPARPHARVLSDVSLFLPAGETTFVVGGSGSGKSTVAALLLRLYAPTAGVVSLDDQDTAFLDDAWVRHHVGGVAQGCVLFDMSVHDNVAIGESAVTREEVVEACRAALMHEFVRDLPEGYETRLGTGGAALSGGQRQRLAIARARLRNPSVLILDEATSALDPTARLLVFEALRRWRAGKTTVVITHDLAQIAPADFVYVLKAGRVAEQGYRADLEGAHGEFQAMAEQQAGGFVPTAPVDTEGQEREAMAALEEAEEEARERKRRHASMAPGLRPITLGNWMFEAVQDVTSPRAPTPAGTGMVPATAFTGELSAAQRMRKRSSLQVPEISVPSPTRTTVSRRLSLQWTPTSPTYTARLSTFDQEDREFEREKSALNASGESAHLRRMESDKTLRTRWDAPAALPAIHESSSTLKVQDTATEDRELGFLALMRAVAPSVPHKALLALGVLVCAASGAATPAFSFLLSKLMFEVSVGARDTAAINFWGALVLGLAAADGALLGLKYAIMEGAALAWVARVRDRCFRSVLAQDKRWFDAPANAPVRLVQVLIKDGDDARSLIATVLAQGVVVASMLGVGLVWAMVQGWQLTLVGLAIGPVFAGAMALQTGLVARCELRNKRAREAVAKGYYEAVANVRGIRSMAFEHVFAQAFEKAADEALRVGRRGAWVEGCTYGLASALIYLAEALLFYVGAILIARGTYTYLQMVQVLNLVVFTVTIGSQLMAFTQRISKAVQATRDLQKLMCLSTDTDESRGAARPAIGGRVALDNVCFAYPERPDVPVLKNASLEIADGECVAIVGASGSGKSTIAALLQRLYEPASGSVSVGAHDIAATDVAHLRNHVAVVSQNPNLFDASIADNIAYGAAGLSPTDIARAAKAANVHEFITALPQGYATPVGENAALISGGQAQRLQIARALARPARILILDECTSALDAANQAAVLETVRAAKIGRTTIMVTHKVPVMQMCDRILVVHEGRIAEQGSYEALMERKGVFATLASGGEWFSE